MCMHGDALGGLGTHAKAIMPSELKPERILSAWELAASLLYTVPGCLRQGEHVYCNESPLDEYGAGRCTVLFTEKQ